MAAELYSQYFGSPQPPIHVGARCFPIKEYFVEDLTSYLSLSPKNAKLAQDIYNDCEKNKCHSAPSASNMQKLYKLATQITTSVGDTGSSVLIFVPGMADIEAISELIEGLNIPNIEFICLPIHSDVPFEEQMAVFEPAKEGEVKVIIATNAAESSLTLPDVDHVICLGLCKQITYNIASHRQMLGMYCQCYHLHISLNVPHPKLIPTIIQTMLPMGSTKISANLDFTCIGNAGEHPVTF